VSAARATSKKRAVARKGRSAASPATSGLDRLWAPWRMTWLKRADAPQGCLFCRVAADSGAKADKRDLVIARRETAMLMLNRYPYASAHLMIAVKRHAGQFRELSPEERSDLLELTAIAEHLLEVEYAPHGMNYGLNVGKVAGAGFPGHLHLHMVPRWNGDTNFMPAIAQARVLPEALDVTWTRLRRALAAAGRRAPAGGKKPVSKPRTPKSLSARGRRG
jgi:ATP adenylyltransferase